MTEQALEAMMADAARYALVRRLGPLLRHNVAGAVQPLSLISMLMEKRLTSATPDLDALRKSSAQLGAMAREASSTCLGVMAWLAPGASDRLAASAGIDEVVNLVRTELSFKGFTLSNQVESVQTEVPLSLTRHVFLAALLALTDASSAPANVVISATLTSNELLLTLLIEPEEGSTLAAAEPTTRRIQWADVLALANSELVVLTHSANRAELRCPVLVTGS